MYFFSPFTKLKTALHRLDHFDMASVYYNYVSPFILYHVNRQSVPVEINRCEHSCYEYCLKTHVFSGERGVIRMLFQIHFKQFYTV